MGFLLAREALLRLDLEVLLGRDTGVGAARFAVLDAGRAGRLFAIALSSHTYGPQSVSRTSKPADLGG